MKSLQVVVNGKTELFSELLPIEAVSYIDKLDSCVIAFNPGSILTYRITGTNYFFRHKETFDKIKKIKDVKSKKVRNSNKETITITTKK